MTDEITQIVGEIVAQIDTTITGVYNPGIDAVNFCKTKWARKGKIITSENDDNFRITGIEYDDYITASSIPAGTTFDTGTYYLPAPFYISGTRLATDREWTLVNSNVMEKTPIVWLLETITEEVYGRGDAREFEATLRLFFLDETNIKDYYTADHRREVVLPMRNLVNSFIEVINNDRRFKTIDSMRIKTFSRFGVETEQGIFQNILDANLSGVELNLTLTKYKQNCKC